MGANLVAPVQQSTLLVTLALAIWVLGEHLTPLRVLGIVLVVVGPALTYDRTRRKKKIGRTPADAWRSRSETAQGVPAELCGRLSVRAPVLDRLRHQPGADSAGAGEPELATSLAAGLVSYLAATLAFALILLLPGQIRHVRQLDAESTRWFVISGVFSCFAQMMRYLALAVAPATVVMPIHRASLLFRLYFSRLVNPHHEEFGGRVIVATIASLFGVLALSVSTELVQSLLPLPDWAEDILNWRWPLTRQRETPEMLGHSSPSARCSASPSTMRACAAESSRAPSSQGMAITVPIGVPLFFILTLVTGNLATLAGFSPGALVALCAAGIVHFVWGRYWNYRATRAMGSNLAGPLQQIDLLVSLGAAIWLGEYLTPLKIFGIVLILLGPTLTISARKPGRMSATSPRRRSRPSMPRSLRHSSQTSRRASCSRSWRRPARA